MTTFVYTEEVMSGNQSSSASVTRFLVELGTTGSAGMGDAQSGAAKLTPSNTPPMSGHHGHRAGSPKPKKRFSVKKGDSRLGAYPAGYPPNFNPHAFTITAYLPNDGGKRLKVHCRIKL